MPSGMFESGSSVSQIAKTTTIAAATPTGLDTFKHIRAGTALVNPSANRIASSMTELTGEPVITIGHPKNIHSSRVARAYPIMSGGAVSSIGLITENVEQEDVTGGSGYESAPIVTLNAPTAVAGYSGQLRAATAQAVVSNGKVIAINVIDGGAGYGMGMNSRIDNELTLTERTSLTSQLVGMNPVGEFAIANGQGTSLASYLSGTLPGKLTDFKTIGDSMMGVSPNTLTGSQLFGTEFSTNFPGALSVPKLSEVVQVTSAKKMLNMAMASAGEVGFDANNPCLALDDMLGPFLPGNPIDDLLNGLISGFLTLAGSLLGAIIGTLANLLGSIISGIVGMISGIIGALTSFFSSVLELIDVNVAMTLEGLFMDPCLNYMMRKSGMVTPPVLNNLIASVVNTQKSQPGVGVWVNPNGTSMPLAEPPSGN